MSGVRLLAAAVLAMLLVPAGATAQAAAPVPGTPAIVPQGANDWNCRPDRGHPHPVVLVHGTFEDALADWYALSPRIKAAGYCVYALDYGIVAGHPGVGGLAPVPESARTLDRFVGRVLAATHASKVLLVAYSQGGLLARYWMRFDSGAGKTAGLVGISPSNHGTDSPLFRLALGLGLAPECGACADQMTGSPLPEKTGRGGDVIPGVRYTVISTETDEVVTPWRSQRLSGDPHQVSNLVLQDMCPSDLNEHIGAPVDPAVGDVVLNALAHGGRADPGVRPACGYPVNVSPAAIVRTLGSVLAVISALIDLPGNGSPA